MAVFGVAKFERFFRLAAELDVDKDDLKRYSEFAYQKLYDLLLIGQAAAAANNRDVIEPHDLPITKGLQERMYTFRRMDQDVELAPILQQLAAYPPLDRAPSEETEAPAADPGRAQPRARPDHEGDRSRAEESADRALGPCVPDIRPPALSRARRGRRRDAADARSRS